MVKPRENRVPIMMSDEELKAIDDWRFANRIATRSEAVRRLAHIGVTFDDHRSELLEAHAAIMAEAIKGIPAASSIAKKSDKNTLEIEVSHALIKTLAKITGSTLLIRMLTGIASNAKAESDFTEIFNESMELTKGLKEEHNLLMRDDDTKSEK